MNSNLNSNQPISNEENSGLNFPALWLVDLNQQVQSKEEAEIRWADQQRFYLMIQISVILSVLPVAKTFFLQCRYEIYNLLSGWILLIVENLSIFFIYSGFNSYKLNIYLFKRAVREENNPLF